MTHSSNKPFNAAEWINGLKAHAEAGTIPPLVGEAEKPAGIVSKLTSRAANAVDSKVPFAKRLTQNFDKGIGKHWDKFSGYQKIEVGMWGAGAVLSAFATLNTARHAVERDDKGNLHTQWSNVGVALLQATFAAGYAYFSLQAFKSASR